MTEYFLCIITLSFFIFFLLVPYFSLDTFEALVTHTMEGPALHFRVNINGDIVVVLCFGFDFRGVGGGEI